MKAKILTKDTKETAYYEKHDILKEIADEPVEMSLETELRNAILSRKRKRKLKNISVKMDPLQIRAIKKIATMKAIPYQTLIRHCLAQYVRKELHI